MDFKKQLRVSLFPAANILLALILLRTFSIAGQNVIQTYPIVRMAALKFLAPEPPNYFWELNIHHVPLQKDQVRNYKDYYEYLLQVFPYLGDAYGVLGYCYHYLGNDDKAIEDLKKAITFNPLYTWNYYNLAIIYLQQSRLEEASALLQQLRVLDAQKSIRRMFASQLVYAPLLDAGGKEVLKETADHLRESYMVCFILLHELNQTSNIHDAQKFIKRLKLELYAF